MSIIRISTLAAAFGLSCMVSVAQAADDRISRIEAAGELRVCFAEDTPWTFKNPATNEWEGLTKDLTALLAEDLGVSLVDVDASWASLVPSLQNDQCDMIGAALFSTTARAKVLLFTIPFAVERSTAFVHVDSDFQTYEQLDQPGKVIVAQSGSATVTEAEEFFRQATVRPVISDTQAAVSMEVVAGRADAHWMSMISMNQFLARNPQFTLRPIGEEPVNEIPIVWALPAKEYHFQQYVNTFISQAIHRGVMADLWEKWYETKYER